MTVKIANAYTAADPSVPTEIIGSPFTVIVDSISNKNSADSVDSTGMIIGVVIATVVCLLVLAVILFLLIRRCRQNQKMQRDLALAVRPSGDPRGAGPIFQQGNANRFDDSARRPVLNDLVADGVEIVDINIGPPINKQQDSDQQNVRISRFQPGGIRQGQLPRDEPILLPPF